jgi:hypothetical protein
MPLRHRGHGKRNGRARSLLLFPAWLACQLSPTHLRAEKPSEYEVKAVYLFQFGKFVRWPVRSHVSSNAFTICVLGEDPFRETLDRILEGETFDGKRPAIRRVRRVQATGDCRMVFISVSEKARLREILEGVKEKNILTVSDIEGFSRLGGMIELVLDDERVRFEVNLDATTKAGLELSSELLKVARVVRRSPPPPRGA